MLKYLNGCTICGDGLVDRMEELIAKGEAESKAAVVVSKEITKILGEEIYSFSAIKSRYRRLTGRDTDHKDPDFDGLEEDEYKTPKERLKAEMTKKKKEPVSTKPSGIPPLLTDKDGEKLVGPQWEWLTENCKIANYVDACWYIGGDSDVRPEANLFLLDKAFGVFDEPESDDEIQIFKQICTCKKIIEKHIKRNF